MDSCCRAVVMKLLQAISQCEHQLLVTMGDAALIGSGHLIFMGGGRRIGEKKSLLPILCLKKFVSDQ